MKVIQKNLLLQLQPSIDKAFGSNIFGVKKNGASPTFENAACHLHHEFIASFDIKDFFPSTTVGNIIRGLKLVAKVEPIAVADADNSVNWSDQLRTFVARLGTRRGRLPQGSPLSPLLANVAFLPFDEKLKELLSHEFGRNRATYTRYFDDLTISLSSSRGLKGHGEFRTKVELVLNEVLSGSTYRLNKRKTNSEKQKDSDSLFAKRHIAIGTKW